MRYPAGWKASKIPFGGVLFCTEKNEARMPFTGMVEHRGFEIAWRLRLCVIWWRKTAGGVWVRILFICHGNICRSTWKFSYIWRFCDLKLLTTPLLHHRAENYYTIWAWYDTRTYHPTGCVCPRFLFAPATDGNIEKTQHKDKSNAVMRFIIEFFLWRNFKQNTPFSHKEIMLY